MTLCIFPAVILLVALLAAEHPDRPVWGLATFLTLFPIWVGALTVGGLVMIPVWIWRLSKRLFVKNAAKTTPQKQLWDQWLDGLEHLQS